MKSAELNEEQFQLYPNPSSGHFWIALPDELNDATIQIIDLAGNVVFQRQENFQGQLKVDLNVPEGVYFLTIRSSSKFTTKKVIKKEL